MEKECVLYDRKCIDCGECNICDLDPKKICDSCGKCIDSGDDYSIVDVDLINENGDQPLNYHYDDENEETEYFEEQDFEEAFDDELSDETDEDLKDEFGDFFA